MPLKEDKTVGRKIAVLSFSTRKAAVKELEVVDGGDSKEVRRGGADVTGRVRRRRKRRKFCISIPGKKELV